MRKVFSGRMLSHPSRPSWLMWPLPSSRFSRSRCSMSVARWSRNITLKRTPMTCASEGSLLSAASSWCLEHHRLKDQRNSSRGADVVDRNLGRKGHPAAAVPHRVALHSLNKEITLAGVIVGRGNGEGIEISALDVVLDPVAIEVCAEKVPQRS